MDLSVVHISSFLYDSRLVLLFASLLESTTATTFLLSHAFGVTHTASTLLSFFNSSQPSVSRLRSVFFFISQLSRRCLTLRIRPPPFPPPSDSLRPPCFSPSPFGSSTALARANQAQMCEPSITILPLVTTPYSLHQLVTAPTVVHNATHSFQLLAHHGLEAPSQLPISIRTDNTSSPGRRSTSCICPVFPGNLGRLPGQLSSIFSDTLGCRLHRPMTALRHIPHDLSTTLAVSVKV